MDELCKQKQVRIFRPTQNWDHKLIPNRKLEVWIHNSRCQAVFTNEFLYTRNLDLAKAKKSWFLSRQGFLASRFVILGTACAVPSGFIMLNSHLVYKYKEIVQLYSSGVAKKLQPDIHEMAEQVRSECTLGDKEKNAIEFFSVYGHEMFHAGSTNLRGGGIVGLPETFSCNKTTDVDKSKLKIFGDKSVDWNSKAGKDLLSSFILSRNAQKFAVAREIQYCTTNYVYAYSILGTVCFLGSYILGNRIAFHYNLYRLPRLPRIMLYSICGSIGLFTYFMIKDSFSQYWDGYADRMAALTSPAYLSGGIEFYEKSLKKNVAIRTLVGEYGGKVYTWHGNKNYFIRTPNLPLTVRLDKLKQMKMESESNETSTIESDQ